MVFTTQRKKPKTTINISRKGSVVKERCKQLSEIALNLFPDRIISDADLKDLVQMYIGADKETVRAYCGYFGHVRAGRCGDNKIVGLSRKGYLEKMGFMHRVNHGRWVIHAQITLENLTQEEEEEEKEMGNRPSAYQGKVNSKVESNDKISLSLTSSDNNGKESEKTPLGVVSGHDVNDVVGGMGGEREEEEAIEKERFFSPKICPKISQVLLDKGLSDEEKMILGVKVDEINREHRGG